MDINKELQERLKLFDQIRKHLEELQQKMGALQEEQKAVYNKGLELKGAIDMLLALQALEAETLKNSKTATLILPEGVKPVVAQESSAPAVEPEKPVVVEQNVTPMTTPLGVK
jgi:predicted RNase H-like nuclease (RuvC/YqgF family)